MHIVVNISKEDYKRIINDIDLQQRDRLVREIANGTVLPEHGRLVDADALTLMDVHLIDGKFLCDAPTILEADNVTNTQ